MNRISVAPRAFSSAIGCRRGTPGAQHRVDEKTALPFKFWWQLRVVAHRLESLFVAVEAEMTHPCSGNEAGDPLDHAETRSQNGHDHQPVFPDAKVSHRFERGLEGYLLAGQVARDLDGHDHGDLCHQPAKLLVPGAPVPQQRELVAGAVRARSP